MFDDASFTPVQGHGLVLNLDFSTFTANVRQAYPHDSALYPDSQGDMQTLPNGNQFIGWGQEPHYSEYTQSGTVLYDVLMPGANMSYRVFRNTWVGTPLTRPAIAVRQVNGRRLVYASWNGSTETVAWQLFAGPSPHALKPISSRARTGFETAIATAAVGPFYQVKALDAAGQVLGCSAVSLRPALLPGTRA
jgi:hypothetical protein